MSLYPISQLPRNTATCVYGIMDYIAVAVTLLIGGFYLVSFLKDIKYFAKIDPIKKQEEDK